MDAEIIKQQIPFTLEETDFPTLGNKYRGKVRDNYIKEDQRVLITTDRISAFDRVLTTLPFKGQVLNGLASFWFHKTKSIIENAVKDYPDPNVMVAKECKVYPVEMVIRGYLAGSGWRDYKAGNPISGIKLPGGLRKSEKFDEPIVTPSTKAEEGHDMPISKEEILKQGIVDKETYEVMEEATLKLFAIGTKFLKERGLIFVDTKYEFGNDGEGVVLVDEIHTPDSSRFWYADTYEERLEKEEDQAMLDKEYIRTWLMEKGFMGDGEIPEIPDDIKVEAMSRYIKAYSQITGQDFDSKVGNVLDRITHNLKEKGYL